MKRLPLAIILFAALALGSCKKSGTAAPTDAGPHGFWSCGTAAGICTCVPIDVDPGPAVRACAASACCFADDDGRCTCLQPGTDMDCAALRTALGAGMPVKACP